ncbi:thionin-like protein 2 [Spinacia oleracea]|uniref:Thionin-like protein 2 n=1 Tax=Spinacia oleracea TaxID=3562 RepID=A0ABM3R536_SPIOL|nr:thionin-like protein 2 [Spinacia oleracea]
MNFKKTKSLITSLLLLIMGFSIMARKCNATTFQECYIPCYILCAIQPTHTLSYCAFECLRDCIIPTNNTHVTSFHFCNLGCASSHCTNISTLKKPGGKEVEGCVRSCNGVCEKNYLNNVTP